MRRESPGAALRDARGPAAGAAAGADSELRFAFRHFPIGDSHPLALLAAEAAEAAGAQGRSRDMHDLLFGAGQSLEPTRVRGLANDLDLDLDRFDSELADETHVRHVMEDVQSGAESGVNGTPTFFINDERLDRNFEMTTLQRALDDAGGRRDLA